LKYEITTGEGYIMLGQAVREIQVGVLCGGKTLPELSVNLGEGLTTFAQLCCAQLENK